MTKFNRLTLLDRGFQTRMGTAIHNPRHGGIHTQRSRLNAGAQRAVELASTRRKMEQSRQARDIFFALVSAAVGGLAAAALAIAIGGGF